MIELTLKKGKSNLLAGLDFLKVVCYSQKSWKYNCEGVLMTVFINITKVQVYLLLFLTSDEYLFWENKSSSFFRSLNFE